ncbi:MAG: integrin alpha [Desulfobulbaceae bacterium]
MSAQVGGVIEIKVDDANACYPLTIDPLITLAADAVFYSNQAFAHFGISVSGAGDVNGDGYADVLVGASDYDNGETDEGVAFVYYGGAAGISATPAAVLESNWTFANFGISVSGAGDVNGDGYADVVVGAYRYENVETTEGAVFVYHGGAAGIGATPASVLYSNQAFANFGISVSGAGDVNGDGYADVVVGAYKYDNGEEDEGAAFVYHGSAAGISAGPAAVLESNQAGAAMGHSVSGAGDVNGDGFADVVVGVPYYDSGETDEGAIFVYHGGAAGISASPAAVLESNRAARMGWSVSGAGDVNGDGYADVLAGAPYYNNGQDDEGAVFVYHGGAAGINGSPAAVLESNQQWAYLGWSVSGAGDLNGDGYADVLAGARNYNNGQLYEGVAFVYYGTAFGISATPAAVLESNQSEAYLGWSVSDAGDVNGDGYADVILGAPYYNNVETDEGAAFVYHGGASGINASPAAVLDSNQADAGMGFSVSSAGDVNGDGYADVVVGAPYYDKGEPAEGAAFVYHGGSSGIGTSPVAVLDSNQANAGMGFSVSSAGDVNGDGYADLVVGAPYYDKGETAEGAAFVYHGGASGINANPAAVLDSNQADAGMGLSVSSAGDVNGDGYADVVVGAPYYDNGETDEGAAFVYHGSAAGIGTSPVAVLDSNQAAARSGHSVSGAGDVNGDGYADVLVGAPYYDNGEADEGAAFVYHGSTAGISASPAVVLESNQIIACLGFSVSGAGDVNGDGYADVLVGAPYYDKGETNEGAAFVYHGGISGISATPAEVLESNQVNANLGYSVSSAGDVNGDGYADVLVGAPYYDKGETNEGAAFVYHGGVAGISATPTAVLDSNQADAGMGLSVSSAGDVNGDGYADVLVGAPAYDNGETNEGAAFVYYGNSGGRPVLARQMRADGSLPVQVWGASYANDAFRVSIKAFHPDGRGLAGLEIQYCPPGKPFGDASCETTTSAAWSDTGLNGTTLAETVSGLSGSTLYKWRARILYAALTMTEPGITGPPKPAHGPWRRYDGQSDEADILTGMPGAKFFWPMFLPAITKGSN